MKKIFLALLFFICAPIAVLGQSADNGYRVPAIDFRIETSGVTYTNPKPNYRRLKFDSNGSPYYVNDSGTKVYFPLGGTAALSANRFIIAGAGGVITAKAAATNGQLLIGSTGAAPDLATLTAGTGMTITNGAGSITLTPNFAAPPAIGSGTPAAITGTTITATGATALNGGISVDTTAFTVADTSGNTAIAGTLVVTGAATFTAGAQSAAVARTATSDGLTTGAITAGTRYVTVTSASANDIITLPAPVIGNTITIFVGANGYELRSSAPATIAINGGTGVDAESAIGADTIVHITCVSATAWLGFQQSSDGTIAKVEVAAP